MYISDSDPPGNDFLRRYRLNTQSVPPSLDLSQGLIPSLSQETKENQTGIDRVTIVILSVSASPQIRCLLTSPEHCYDILDPRQSDHDLDSSCPVDESLDVSRYQTFSQIGGNTPGVSRHLWRPDTRSLPCPENFLKCTTLLGS